MTNVGCSPTQIMEIVNAEYYHGDSCSLPAACVMKRHCDGQRLCNITVRNNLFNFDPCPGRIKRLRVEYKCMDNLGSPLTSGKLLFGFSF